MPSLGSTMLSKVISYNPTGSAAGKIADHRFFDVGERVELSASSHLSQHGMAPFAEQRIENDAAASKYRSGHDCKDKQG